jgi:hypothetical protein
MSFWREVDLFGLRVELNFISLNGHHSRYIGFSAELRINFVEKSYFLVVGVLKWLKI